MTWHVLLTEPNRESVAARHLRALGCELYLPMLSRAKYTVVNGGRRWRVWRRPLMPGYLFGQARRDLLELARIAAGVRQRDFPFLGELGRPAAIPQAKIEELRILEAMLNARRSGRLQFRLGDRVAVVDGPFTGLRATVYQLSDQERVTLLLDFLGRPTKVAVATSALEGAAA